MNANGVVEATGAPADDASGAPAATPPPNPFVGPVPLDEGQKLHGRRRETADLAALLVSKRIVLLFSPSGAGKTSLIRAGLMPVLLADYDIEALPVVRLGYRDPECSDDPAINRYRVAMLYALEKRRDETSRRPASELRAYTLKQYFEQCVLPSMGRKRGDPNYPLLIIDQFEELFTVDPLDVDKKREFLEELGDLLRGDAPSRWGGGEAGAPIWALFSIREDRIAELQPYLDLIPTSLSFRHRLDALDVEEANEAIRETAGETWMSQDVPQRLVDDLCRVSVRGADGRETLQPGRFVEPVQLQVVCRGLWNKIVARQGRKILGNDVEPHEHSEVDRALREFFDDEVDAAADHAGVSERKLREWIEAELISPSGVRTQVLREPESLGKVDLAIAKLVDAHLLRSDRRAGREWVELPHDRLVAPVRDANREWAESHLKPFQLRAGHWREASGDHARRLLLEADELEPAKAFARDHLDDLTDTEKEFLDASEQEVKRRRQRRRDRILVRAAIGAAAAVVIGVLLYVAAEERNQRIAEQEAKQQAEARSEINRRLSSARESDSIGEALDALLGIYPEARTIDPDGSLPRRVDNAIRQQLTRTPAAVLHELEPRGHVVWSLAFTERGDRVLAGSWDGHISLQAVDDVGARVVQTPDLQSETYALAFHRPTGVIASTHGDGRVLLWRLQTDRLVPLATLNAARKQMTTASFSRDGRWLAAGGWEKKVEIWDVRDPAAPVHKATLAGSHAPIQSISFIPGTDADGRQRLASTDYDGKVFLWSIGENMPSRPAMSRELQLIDRDGEPVGISASSADPSGRYFVVGDTDGSLYIWDLASPEPRARRLRNATHRGGPQDTHVKGIAFGPRPGEFVSVGVDGYLIHWTLLGMIEGTPINQWQKHEILAQRFRIGERLFSVAHRPNAPGQVAVGGTRAILLVDLARGAGPALATPLPGAPIRTTWKAVSMDDAGARIAASDRHGPIRFWRRDGRTIRPAQEWSIALAPPFAFAISPNGERIVTVDCRGLPEEWSLSPGAAPRRVQTVEAAPREACAMRGALTPAISPDGRFLATAEQNEVRVWARAERGVGAWRPWASHRLSWRVPGTPGNGQSDVVSSLAINADSTYLSAGAHSGAVHLWRLQRDSRGSGFEPLATTDVGQRVTALTFSPNSKVLVAGGEDGFVTECSVPGLEKEDPSARHERRITSASYSRLPEKKARAVLVTADADGYLVEWSRRQNDAKQLSTTDIAGEGSPSVNAMALSADGKFLVTAGDGLFAWNFEQARVHETARAYVRRTHSDRSKANAAASKTTASISTP